MTSERLARLRHYEGRCKPNAESLLFAEVQPVLAVVLEQRQRYEIRKGAFMTFHAFFSFIILFFQEYLAFYLLMRIFVNKTNN